MAIPDQLAELEAERDRWLSMIAYHKRARFGVEPWFNSVVIAMLCGIVALAVTYFSGQIALSHLIFVVLFLVVAAYIYTRKVTLFGITMRVAEIGDLLVPGGPEAHRRLADCEAQIMKLKESRP